MDDMPGIEGYRAALAAHMDPKNEPDLSDRTLAEREAGRARIVDNLRMSVLEVGRDELVRRFPRCIGSAALHFDEANNFWVADVYVHTAAGTMMSFKEDLLEFPSDHIIAQIALVT